MSYEQNFVIGLAIGVVLFIIYVIVKSRRSRRDHPGMKDVALKLIEMGRGQSELAAHFMLGIKHIREWANQPPAGLTEKQVMDSVVRMCDDILGGN